MKFTKNLILKDGFSFSEALEHLAFVLIQRFQGSNLCRKIMRTKSWLKENKKNISLNYLENTNHLFFFSFVLAGDQKCMFVNPHGVLSKNFKRCKCLKSKEKKNLQTWAT